MIKRMLKLTHHSYCAVGALLVTVLAAALSGCGEPPPPTPDSMVVVSNYIDSVNAIVDIFYDATEENVTEDYKATILKKAERVRLSVEVFQGLPKQEKKRAYVHFKDSLGECMRNAGEMSVRLGEKQFLDEDTQSAIRTIPMIEL